MLRKHEKETTRSLERKKHRNMYTHPTDTLQRQSATQRMVHSNGTVNIDAKRDKPLVKENLLPFKAVLLIDDTDLWKKALKTFLIRWFNVI